MHPLRIEYRAPDQLKPYPRNARTHSKKQIRQIAESIRQFGFTNPIIIDGEDAILAGHGRAEAARLVGLKSVPCVRLDQMSPEQKRAYILADNKLAQNAGWDEEILATELQFLLKAEIDFGIGVIGFETHRCRTKTASLDSPSAEPQPFGGAFPGFFGTVWCGSGERQKTRDSVAVLAVRSQPVSPCNLGKCRVILQDCRESVLLSRQNALTSQWIG